jgi:hypothetical protein
MLRRAFAASPLVVAVLPPALIAWTVYHQAVAVPFWDDWELVDLLHRASLGTLRFADFWTQHNEHRLVLPGLLMLGLARATAWDPRVTMAASVVISLVTLGVLGIIVDRSFRSSAPALRSWVILGASLMTFSMVAWQNWLWAWQVQIFMNGLAACSVAWALGRYGPRWPGPLLAVLAAIAGTLSFANGLVLLAVVPIVLSVDPRDAGSGRRAGIVTALIGFVVIAIYMVGLDLPPAHPSPLIALAHPLALGAYVLVYLGSPLAVGWWLATSSVPAVIALSAAFGAVGLVIVAAGAFFARRRVEHAALVPWLALVLFTVLSGTMTGVGRLGTSLDSALASRYTTTSGLFWVSVIAVVALATSHLLRRGAVIGRSVVALIVILVVVELFSVAGYSSSWILGLRMADAHDEVLRRGGECLQFYRTAPMPCLKLLYPDPAELRARANRLEALALGPFAPGRTERALASYSIAQEPETPGSIELLRLDDMSAEFIVAGWGVDPTTHRAAHAVLIVVDGEVIGRAVTGLEHPDASGTARAAPTANAGWAFRFSTFRLKPGSHAVEAYVVLGQEHVARLAGARVIEVTGGRT